MVITVSMILFKYIYKYNNKLQNGILNILLVIVPFAKIKRSNEY